MKMCPHCGDLFPESSFTLIPTHRAKDQFPPATCPGSRQNPRNPETDNRPLWNGEPNPHLPEVHAVSEFGEIVTALMHGYPVQPVGVPVAEELLKDSEVPNRVRDLPQGDFEILLRNGCFTLNEYRERYNLPPLEGPRGEAPFIPEPVPGLYALPFTPEEAAAAGIIPAVVNPTENDPQPYIRGPAESE